MYLIISYVRHNKATILVVEYDEQLLFPLLVECYKLLTPNVVENFQLQCPHVDFDMIFFIKQRKQMLIIWSNLCQHFILLMLTHLNVPWPSGAQRNVIFLTIVMLVKTSLGIPTNQLKESFPLHRYTTLQKCHIYIDHLDQVIFINRNWPSNQWTLQSLVRLN
jgi:hypothetical protein